MPLAISIDNFIDTEKGNDRLALCAKLAIIKSILEAKRKSLLYINIPKGETTINFASLENTWYLSFFRTLTENCTAEDILERFSDITLIIFNYDRCIEHFLVNALINYYRFNEFEAVDLVSNLEIIHPYGTVGSLSWQDKTSSTSVSFGGTLDSTQLVDYAQGITTFTEGA
jgi:hypothetical protein